MCVLRCLCSQVKACVHVTESQQVDRFNKSSDFNRMWSVVTLTCRISCLSKQQGQVSCESYEMRFLRLGMLYHSQPVCTLANETRGRFIIYEGTVWPTAAPRYFCVNVSFLFHTCPPESRRDVPHLPAASNKLLAIYFFCTVERGAWWLSA